MAILTWRISNTDMQTLIEEKRKSGVLLTCLAMEWAITKTAKWKLSRQRQWKLCLYRYSRSQPFLR
jgi:hypothetical protein